MKKKISFFLVFPLIFSLVLSSSMVVNAQEIEYLALPSIPLGIVYNDKSTVYVALCLGSSIAVIDTKTLNYTLYELTSWHPDYKYPMPFAVAIDGEGNVWVTIDGFKITPYHPPPDMYWCIAKFITSIKTFEYIRLNLPSLRSSDTVTFHNGFIWTVNGEYLSKINYTTNTIIGIWNLGGRCSRCEGDDDVLWISSPGTNEVLMFNITTNNVEKVITGFDRPLGIAVDSNYVYLAENKRIEYPLYEPFMGTIARYNKLDGKVDKIETALVTNEGPYELYLDTYHNLWWTDNSGHIGIVIGKAVTTCFDAIGRYCYFMTQVGNKMWFSCAGSAYVGMAPIPNIPVGGIWVSVDKLSLLAPYIGVTTLLAIAVMVMGYAKKRMRTKV